MTNNERETKSMEIKFKKLHMCAIEPTYGTEDSAGGDLRSTEDVRINPGETVLVPTGLAIEIPQGNVGLLFPRSGLSIKTNLRMANSVGVIDSDYRGEVKCGFTNIGNSPVEIKRGDRMAQIVITPYVKCAWTEVQSLDETSRGSGGFGSTGNR